MPGRSKTDARYWLEKNRLFRDRSPDYSCRFTYKGRRERFCLKQPNKKVAASIAAEIYGHLLAHGWDETLRRYKGIGDVEAEANETTVGQVIAASQEASTARESSFESYAKSLRKIVAEIERIGDGRKFDSKGGGTEAWRRRVDAVPISRITPERVIKWKNRRIRANSNDPASRSKAITTANSLIRNAKSIFGKRLLPYLNSQLELPSPLPFEGVSLEKSTSLRYHSTIDARALLDKAEQELRAEDAEAYKILTLALICGLRKGEIDNLLWDRFDFENATLTIESSQYHQLKSEDSSGELDLDQRTLAIFKEFRSDAPDSEFVINSPYKPASYRQSRSYRCEAIFDRLNGWLRANGVDAQKPLHTLRKEIGSIIAAQYGIFQASRYLRHSDIRITAAVYADKKQRVVPSL